MLIQHVMHVNRAIGIVDSIKEQKDAIVKNQQQVLPVHNVVMIITVNGLAIGEKELVHSIFTILKTEEVFPLINIFSPMFFRIFHAVILQQRSCILVSII